jgi:hypothetical protein
MTQTPEAAAAKVVGKYTVWDVMSFADLDRWDMLLYSFMRDYIYDAGIRPCKCGAYRTEDECQVCERVKGCE